MPVGWSHALWRVTWSIRREARRLLYIQFCWLWFSIKCHCVSLCLPWDIRLSFFQHYSSVQPVLKPLHSKSSMMYVYLAGCLTVCLSVPTVLHFLDRDIELDHSAARPRFHAYLRGFLSVFLFVSQSLSLSLCLSVCLSVSLFVLFRSLCQLLFFYCVLSLVPLSSFVCFYLLSVGVGCTSQFSVDCLSIFALFSLSSVCLVSVDRLSYSLVWVAPLFLSIGPSV